MIPPILEYPPAIVKHDPAVKALYERIKALTHDADIKIYLPIQSKPCEADEILILDTCRQRSARPGEILRVEYLKQRQAKK